MTSPLSAPGRLALPVCHRLRLRQMPGGLGWLASLHIKTSDSFKIRDCYKKTLFFVDT
jgi:hypothetical protein